MKQDIIKFDDNGRPHGEYLTYYDDGNIKVKGQFFHGLRDGCWERYNPDCSIDCKINFNKGLYHGLYESYDNDGNIIQCCYYENNILKYRFICKHTK